MSRPALIAWAVGSSRNRDNWRLTSVMRLRNVLSLITLLALKSYDAVSSVDPDGSRYVFEGCPCEVVHYRDDGCDPGYEDDWRNGDDYIEDEWADHYNNSLNWYISEYDKGR